MTILLLLVATTVFAATDESNEKKEKALRFVPLITSTPLTGTGVGVAASYLYKLGEDSATSQLQIGAQYSDTDSITTFLRNNAFLKSNTLISNSGIAWSDINSEFDGDDGSRVEYKIKSVSLAQKILFQVKDDIYWGGHVAYKNVEYSPNNEAGEDFLFDNGIVDGENVAAGVSFSYDTRESKHFPSDAYLSGGSFGEGGRERDDDGTYWAAGVGGRYAIQSKTGVDLRLDLVTTSESEQSVYLALNQAF